MKTKRLFYNLICPLIGVAAIAGVWAAASAIYNKPLILPGVADITLAFVKLFGSGKFYLDVAATFARSIICFVLSYLFALPLALASAFSKTFASVFKPFAEVLRSVPMIAVILVALAVFNSSVLPVVVGFLMVFPLAYSAFYNALTNADVVLSVETCRLFKARRRDIVRYAYMPVLLPSGVLQAQSLLPLSVKVAVSGEVLAYTRRGLGLAMQSAQINVEIDKLAAYALIAVLLSYACLGLVKLLELILRRCRLCR